MQTRLKYLSNDLWLAFVLVLLGGGGLLYGCWTAASVLNVGGR